MMWNIVQNQAGAEPRKRRLATRLLSGAATLAGGILVGGVLIGGARAAEQPNAGSVSTTQVGEVIVTAERRTENLQRVPIAVTAYDAKMLSQRQLATLTDVTQNAPNVQYASSTMGSGSAANITIRGIGQIDNHPTADPGVGLYVDGVYLARASGAAIDLGDMQQVEVLRGPQGTLFGRNTIGGALNITTKAPTDSFGGELQATVGNLDRYEGRVTLNLPLVDDRADLRLNGLYTQNDGYGRATVDGAGPVDLGAQREFAGRAELLLKPGPATQILISADGTTSRGGTDPVAMVAFDPTQVVSYPLNGTPPIGPQYVTGNLNNLHYNISPKDNLDVAGGSITITQKLNADLTFKSITAYRWLSEDSGQDYSASPAQYLSQVIDESGNQTSQEFQLLGSPLGGDLTWVAGLYFFTESDAFDSSIVEFNSPYNVPVSNGTNSYAAYGQATYKLTDKLSLTAGLRYTDERKSISATTTAGATVLVPHYSRSVTASAISPKGAIEYQITDQIMAYASISQGFKSGGFNGLPFSTSAEIPYAPETSTAYEVGVKSELFDRRLRLNLAGYYTSYKNIQLTAQEQQGSNYTVVTGNAASAEIYGFEGEFEARVAAPLTLLGSLGLTGDSLSQNPGFSFGTRVLPNTPKVTASLGFNYAHSVSDVGEAVLNLTANYHSTTLPQFDPTPWMPAYTLVNAQLTFTPTRSPWKLNLYAKNLGDARYWVYAETTGIGPTIAYFGRPREYGASVAYSF